MYNFLNLLLLMPGTSGGQQEGGGSFFQSPLFMIVIMMGIFYFILILPQQRKAKKDQQMRSELKEGEKVLTTGGIIGTIEKVKEHSLIIRVGKNTQIEVIKGAVSRKIEKKDDIKGEQT